MENVEQLRDLADLLDLHFGVDTRKAVLEGSERLVPGSSAGDWQVFFATVSNRVTGMLVTLPAARAQGFDRLLKKTS